MFTTDSNYQRRLKAESQKRIAEETAAYNKFLAQQLLDEEEAKKEEARLKGVREAAIQAERDRRAQEDKERLEALIAPRFEKAKRAWLISNSNREPEEFALVEGLIRQTVLEEFFEEEIARQRADFRQKNPFSV